MKEFLELLRHRINALGDFMNRLQGVIGLKDSQDDSIHGKLNNLSTQINAIQIPKYYVEVLTVIDNYFLTTHEPLNGVCLNNEITIYHPDDAVLEVEETMTELNTKLDLLPTKMDESIIKNMYGKMEIKNDTMEIYDTAGVLIRTFNLFDYVGNPTTTAGVFKREIKTVIP